ncbi:hypothetical protein BYZ73_20340 [Rhodovulum viride]|uniref:DUF2169 domain-containing protein n=1 Tax=Rhodovulum viride TaxID=1231134 RepID=A0ABX9DDP0_9RHOB|nr:DUF2169 domain-containing protein [Rhodovulum viride]RAP39468.1 hypothetical protein BYZ73_20340 [Rhodovulum viride]
MLHTNNTPFAAIGFEQWKPDGTPMACIAARCSLLLHEGAVHYAGTQALVLADEFAGDPHREPMLKAGDLVPFRPGADITVIGSAHAPEPAREFEAAIRVGPLTKRLRLTGPRHWVHDGRWRLSEPEPVSEVPLSWRLASGGRIVGDPDGDADPRNPIGAGIVHPLYTSEKLEIPAPQISSAKHPMSLDPARPADPEGVGPVPPWWQTRARHAGTYDRAWQETHHPLLPADFDYRFYQVAPPGLQLAGFLAPGMPVEGEGLLPGAAPFRFRLPDLMLFAKFSFTDGREVTARLNLDGLHLDLREGVAFDLSWRAWIPSCPAFYRIDLELGRWDEVMAMGLPVPGAEGLEIA